MLGVGQLGATVRLRIIEGLGLSDRVQLEEVRGPTRSMLDETSRRRGVVALEGIEYLN